MIITDQFVVLNFPKTGSSFVRKVLKQIHNYDSVIYRLFRKLKIPYHPSMIELKVPIIDRKTPGFKKSQHGLYIQIPETHKHKEIVSVSRNPFDRYVSAYLFSAWKRIYPEIYGRELTERYPHFPALTFLEYYRMIHTYIEDFRLKGSKLKIPLGVQTVQFIQFYFRDPDTVLHQIDHAYLDGRKYESDQVSVNFLEQKNLNKELYEFLRQHEYPEKNIEFIQKADKVRITPRRKDQEDIKLFYTPELVEEILMRDKLIFDLFPQYTSSLL